MKTTESSQYLAQLAKLRPGDSRHLPGAHRCIRAGGLVELGREAAGPCDKARARGWSQ